MTGFLGGERTESWTNSKLFTKVFSEFAYNERESFGKRTLRYKVPRFELQKNHGVAPVDMRLQCAAAVD